MIFQLNYYKESSQNGICLEMNLFSCANETIISIGEGEIRIWKK